MTERPEKKPDKPSEGDSQTQVSTNLAKEGVSGEEQAPKYEPKFKSFSGHGSEHALSHLGTERNEQSTGSAAAHNVDWFSSLMRRLTAPEVRNNGGVAEFVIEDKERNTEHTAAGERYVARPSYLDGLRAQVASAKSPQEAEQIQALFSIEYILKKARDLGAAALSSFAPHTEPGKVYVSDDPHAGENDLRQRHNIPESVIVASRFDNGSDAAQIPLEPVKPRQVDAGVTFQNEFASPPDVLTVRRDGKPGKVTNMWLRQSSLLGEDGNVEEFVKQTAEARRALVMSHPAAPPLVCLDIPKSAVGTATEPAVASRLAHDEKVFVLGMAANNHDLILFGPDGKELPYKITDPESGEQWERIREISTANFNYNEGWKRNPDYRENQAFDAVTRAPADVVSVAFHGIPGAPQYQTYEQALAHTKAAKQDCIANQARDHRKLHQPIIIEVLSCDSATGPNKRHDVAGEEMSVAARLARDTGSWTIGYGSTVDGQSGKGRDNPLAFDTKGEPVVLFDPKGHPIGEKFDTPLTVESWKKIRKYTETYRGR